MATKVSKVKFKKIYRSEHDTNVKERMLLVLKVTYDKQIPAQVARDLHRSRTWASDWLEIQGRRLRRLKGQNKNRKTSRYIRRSIIRDKKRVSIQQTRMDYKTAGRRSNCKKEWWNKIPLYPHLQTHA